MSNQVYDILKKIQHLLPIIGTLYLAISQIWGFPYAEQVNATIVAICAALGSSIELLCYNYKKDQEDNDNE